MARNVFIGLSAAFLVVVLGGRAEAQDWSPPSRQMPAMPQASEVSSGWMSSQSGWFGGAARAAGVDASQLRVSSEGSLTDGHAQVVRASAGPLPVVVWQDRNGDARADLIEVFRGGSVIYQLIDADYDGTANVLRVYDATGALIREDRL